MERELGISYPTVRGRVDALIRALGLADGAESRSRMTASTPSSSPTSRRHRSGRPSAASILERLARKEIGAEEAAGRASRAGGRGLMATYVRTQEIAHDIGVRGRFALRVTSPDVELRAGDGTAATVRIKVELRAGSEEEADELFDRMRFHVRAADGLLEVTEPRRDDSGIGTIVHLLGIGSARIDDASIDAVLPPGTEIAFEGVDTDLTAVGLPRLAAVPHRVGRHGARPASPATSASATSRAT